MDKKLKDNYFGKKVLVTGHTGFKGAWFCQILLEFGAEVFGYSLAPNTEPNLYSILKLKKHLKEDIADIRGIRIFNQAVEKFKPDIIFHLAAQPIVRRSYDQPHYTYETNVVGTINVLEAIRLNQIPAGVIITTDKVYKNLEKDYAYREDDQLGGYDPYSTSKACADLITGSYIQSYFNPPEYKKSHHTLIASARGGNVIGGGDWASDRLIPDAIRSFLADGGELIIRNPKAIRPWQHVLEPLSGYLKLGAELLAGRQKFSGAWNFGPAESDMQNVETVLALLIAKINKGKYTVQPDKLKHEAGNLKLDNSKARKLLGWQPKFDLGRAVEATALWYRDFYHGKKNMAQITSAQIKDYFGK